MGYLPSANVYEDRTAYPSAVDVPKMKIFRFEENIYYANVDMFKKLFTKRINFRVDDQIKAMNSEITEIERAHRNRVAQPNKLLAHVKRRFMKETTLSGGSVISTETLAIDLNKLEEEKKEKVSQSYEASALTKDEPMVFSLE